MPYTDQKEEQAILDSLEAGHMPQWYPIGNQCHSFGCRFDISRDLMVVRGSIACTSKRTCYMLPRILTNLLVALSSVHGLLSGEGKTGQGQRESSVDFLVKNTQI